MRNNRIFYRSFLHPLKKILQNDFQLNFEKCGLIFAILNFLREGFWVNRTRVGDLTRIVLKLWLLIAKHFSEQMLHVFISSMYFIGIEI